MRLPRALAATALATSMVAIPAVTANAQDADVFVRVTYICKATQDGEPENTPGFTFSTGDYVFRYRNEGDVPTDWTSGVNGSGLHSGSLAVDEVDYQATPQAVGGVSVTTTTGPNGYRGTASANETPCTYPDEPIPTLEPTPTPTPTPTATPAETPEATEEPVPTDVPAGRPGSGEAVTSTQLAGLAALTTVGVAGAIAVTRRRQEP